MAVSEHDKNRARGHLGYGMVQQAATFILGVPAATQTAFMIEGAWARILPSAEKIFTELLDRMDRIESQVDEDIDALIATKVGDIEINEREFLLLVQRYKYWQGKLSNMLQVPPNPFDMRPYLGEGYGGGTGMNVPVG